jgi:type IV pilus assembly protein PilV
VFKCDPVVRSTHATQQRQRPTAAHVFLDANLTMNTPFRTRQHGFLMIEALIAILIFTLGVLGLVAMGATAIGAQSDARYRTDASRLTENIANTIQLSADRSNPDDPSVLVNSIAPFEHMNTGSCGSFAGTASTKSQVTDWLTQVATTGPGLPGLPGTGALGQQIIITSTAAGYNKVEVTVCWSDPGSPAGAPMRRHTFVTYVN